MERKLTEAFALYVGFPFLYAAMSAEGTLHRRVAEAFMLMGSLLTIIAASSGMGIPDIAEYITNNYPNMGDALKEIVDFMYRGFPYSPEETPNVVNPFSVVASALFLGTAANIAITGVISRIRGKNNET